MTNTNIFPSNEIVGALAVNNFDSDSKKAFLANPNQFIFSNSNIDLSDIDINVIENTDKEINLTLPFYSQLDKLEAKTLNDDNLNNASGGEIIFAIGAILGTACGIVGAAVLGGASVGTLATIGVGATVIVGAAVAGTAVAAGTIAVGVEADKYVKAQKKSGQK